MPIPRATYRFQFHPAFRFSDAEKLIPYIKKLGVSDLYASPVFAAKKDSTHGYDIVDPKQLNPELGGEMDFERLIHRLQSEQLSWLQDIVPNHMSFDRENLMLMDIFENGPASRYAEHFDVNWNHYSDGIRGRIVAPFLGKFFGEALEAGEIKLNYDQTGFAVSYFDLRYPLRIETYLDILGHELPSLHNSIGQKEEFKKLMDLISLIKSLSDANKSQDRFMKVFQIKTDLWNLYSERAEIRIFIDQNVKTFNGIAGNPASFNLLEALLLKQFFRLSFWKFGTEEINFRRFFNINELITVSVERMEVLEETHSLIFRLIDEGKIQGVRVDHVDGLYNPLEYLKRLRSRIKESYLVVEKILQLDEHLPADWPVDGTTGYEFANYANQVFCQRNNAGQMSRIYERFIEEKISYSQKILEKKWLILGKHMAGDIDNLAHLLKKISSGFRYAGDITIYGLKRAMVEVMAFFPVYRTYISPENFTDEERSLIKIAVAKARESSPALLYEINFIERFLLLQYPDFLPQEDRSQWLNFVMRFQQFTGPLMAKGFEDTLLYDYNRLLSLNEVGGNPGVFGLSVDEFHSFLKKRSVELPQSMNATSTHDTKRSEDVRARIAVLSELPVEWQAALRRWEKINRPKKTKVRELVVPMRNDEYFLYQTLLGSFPFDRSENNADYLERMKAYSIKAIREGKVHTAWLKPDEEYEKAYLSFLEKILSTESNPFLDDFVPFQKRIAEFGIYNSLSQTLIKLTAPGVPDFYQGCELWDFSLVDPDNRRPVDYSTREKFLEEMTHISPAEEAKYLQQIVASREDGRIKMFLTWKGLQLRKEISDVFHQGTYIPLVVQGKFKDNIIAFARSHEKECVVTIAARFLTQVVDPGRLPIADVWEDTAVELPSDFPSSWTDCLCKDPVDFKSRITIKDAFRFFPGALLSGR